MCWHEWGKWRVPCPVEVARAFGEFGATRQVVQMVQTRECRKCYKVESRVVHDGQEKRP